MDELSPNCRDCDYRAQLDAIMESSFDGMYICDGQGKFIKVNQSFERVTGIPRENLLGTYAPDMVKNGILDKSVTALVLKTRKRTTITQHLFGPNGVRECMVTSTPALDADGNIKYIVANIRDMTELIKLRDDYARSQEVVQRYSREISRLRESSGYIVAKSPQMERVVSEAAQVAASSATVLLEGESGTGKELVARFIHSMSDRCNGPFLAINCGAIPETLVEAELFGYEKGAFTGARADGKIGLFQAASGGTLYLDEIGCLPIHLQSKLLRALESAEAIPVGGTKPKSFNCRFIAASNEDLSALCRSGKFRMDLYYRLNVVKLKIPPLRERKGDIEPLCVHFLKEFNQKYSTNKRFSPEAIKTLTTYSWPGNVRELRNAVERAVITSQGDLILPADLPAEIVAADSRCDGNYRIVLDQVPKLKELLKAAEEAALLKALAEHRSTRAIAKALGISQASVVRKLKALRDSGTNMAIRE
ncbi:MAG TPA: sigma 54-interacting transcriptional regulator [Firmicutes bacterium]|nr:sigma 54-interacting transcriptional regulator [Bacillota bacterium]